MNHTLLNTQIKIYHRLLALRASEHAIFILIDPNPCLLHPFFDHFTFVDVIHYVEQNTSKFGIKHGNANHECQ